MRNYSYENEFHLHVHFHANQSHFHSMVSHVDSFQNRGKGQLGNGLFTNSALGFHPPAKLFRRYFATRACILKRELSKVTEGRWIDSETVGSVYVNVIFFFVCFVSFCFRGLIYQKSLRVFNLFSARVLQSCTGYKHSKCLIETLHC